MNAETLQRVKFEYEIQPDGFYDWCVIRATAYLGRFVGHSDWLGGVSVGEDDSPGKIAEKIAKAEGLEREALAALMENMRDR